MSKPPKGNEQTAQEKAYAFIRTAILQHGLKLGQNLIDGDLASTLGISRTPVREALRRLEREGLVVHSPRRGWAVYTLDAADIEQIFDIKQAVEGMAVLRATERLTDGHARALRSALADMESAAAAHDRPAYAAADLRLHEAIFSAAENPRAAQLSGSLNAQFERLRLGLAVIEDRMGHSAVEHRKIVERMLSGDGPGAEALMREHLWNLRTSLLNVWTHIVLPFVPAQEG